MGLAGKDAPDSRQRAAKVNRAEFFIDRARECYKRVEDIAGECEHLFKKSVIARLRGDEQLAEEWAQNYLLTHEAAMERIA
jgi:anaphase-promoting complex subunit 5